MDKPPASIALEALGIPHRVFTHEQPVSTFEEAASQRGQRPGQIVRSILFQVRPEEFVMVLVAGPKQVDWKKLRRHVKRSRVRMATEEEVLDVTGFRIGTVSPFGVRTQVRVLVDASVLKEEEVSLGSGVRNMAIVMKSADVFRALGKPEIVDFLEST
ncbi:MAG: YbaK/EbsC family protein [Chloroflexi bacterium]|nr:YbaK/EbsC family protein [Chloroflexota bacterium]